MPPTNQRRLSSLACGHRRRKRARRLRAAGQAPAWRLTAVLALVAMAAMPATASAAPLTEVEPNDSALSANGPIPPDGYLATRSTPDDHDVFLLRLGGRRQVTLTLTRVSGCDENTNLNSTTFSLTARDGTPIIGITNFSGGSGIYTHSWTTPRDPTEYVGDISGDGWWQGHQCQVLVQVTPVDALITGPLPAPSFNRTLTVIAPGQVRQAARVPITAGGAAADEDRVAVLWTTGGCPAAPDESVDGIVLGDKLATGPYGVTLATMSPSTEGTPTLCTWLYDTLGKLPPLLRQQTVLVGAAHARLSRTMVKHNKKLTIVLTNVPSGAAITVRWSRHGKTTTQLVTTVNGRARVTAPKRKGRYRLSVSYLGRVLTRKTVTIT